MASAGNSAAYFTVVVTGQVEGAELNGCSNAYCKLSVVSGEDWGVLDGVEEGISQITRAAPDGHLVWNFPVDIAFKSTNVFGWPQLILSVFEVDGLGRDVICGYGRVHIPIAAGRYSREVKLFKPLSSSLMQQFITWLTGTPAEYADPKFPAKSDGREVTRVASSGVVNVVLNVLTKDMAAFGYSEDQGPDGDYRADGSRLL